MNLEVMGVTEPPARTVGWADAKDWFAMLFLGAGYVAQWAYVFLHPSTEAFGICVGSLGVFGTAFHWIAVKDDKVPDRKGEG